MQSTKKIPRASFSITILDDEDYRLLMSERGGMEAFGVFVAICLVGRQRLLDRRAHQITGTDSLLIENSVDHVLDMARVSRKQFDACLASIKSVASQSGSEAWFRVDENGLIIIRSFFKFNADSNHGGSRPGAGRRISGNQDDSRRNQDGFKLDSTEIQDESKNSNGAPSVSSPVSVSVSSPSSANEIKSDDDGDPPMQLDGPLGPNTAKQVRETLYTAEAVFPLTNVRIMAHQWLVDHPAARVVAAIMAAGDRKPVPSFPTKFIQSLLDDPAFPQARKNGPPPKPSAPPKPVKYFNPADHI